MLFRSVGDTPELIDPAQYEPADLAMTSRSDCDLLADEELLGVGVRHRVAGGCCLGGKRGRKKQKDSWQEVQGFSHG